MAIHISFKRLVVKATVLVSIVLSLGCEPSEITTRSNEIVDPDPVPITIPMTLDVVKVIDGDTIAGINRAGRSITVQLLGVDAPELQQEFGLEARERLLQKVKGRTLRLELAEEDEFDRKTAEVFDDDESLNVWVIRQGCGWYNWKFDTDPAKVEAEKVARKEKLGLWSGESPVAPWHWKNPPDDGRLYVQGNGSRYHRSSCRTLDNRRVEISLDAALKTHTPCQVCKPPIEPEPEK